MLLSLILALSGLSLPLDHDLVEPSVSTGYVQEVETPFLQGTASWYDYKLGGKWRSKTHDTCALRIYQRYGRYKVCSDRTGKCVECYHNDYGPARSDRVIDLSSHAFKELGVPLSVGLTPVTIYSVD